MNKKLFKKYSWVSDFYEGLARVESNGKWFYINKQDERVEKRKNYVKLQHSYIKKYAN